MKTRICVICKKEFPETVEFFKPGKRKPLGILSECKKCNAMISMRSIAKSKGLSLEEYILRTAQRKKETKAKQQLKEKIKIFKEAEKEAKKVGNQDYRFIQELAEAKLKEIKSK